MKGILGTTAIIIAALTAAPASAGTLYKCLGADGVTSYVSKRVAGAQCSTISYTRSAGRAVRELGLGGFVSMQLTLGAAILSALVHGPWAVWLALALPLSRPR